MAVTRDGAERDDEYHVSIYALFVRGAASGDVACCRKNNLLLLLLSQKTPFPSILFASINDGVNV